MNIDSIKHMIALMLEKMGIAHESIEEVVGEGDVTRLNIQTKESGLLIGPKGETVAALNHLVKKIAGKNEEKQRLSIDVNGYLEESGRALREKVLILAERAKSFKTSVELEPMSPYERMMVHSFLSEDPHVTTESIGEGKNRRIIIAYKEDQ